MAQYLCIIDTIQERFFLTDSQIVRFRDLADKFLCKYVAAAVWPRGFPGMVCSQRVSQDVPSSVAGEDILVCSSRQSCEAGPPFQRMQTVHWSVASGGKVGIRNSPLGAPSSSPVHQCVDDQLGHSSPRSYTAEV